MSSLLLAGEVRVAALVPGVDRAGRYHFATFPVFLRVSCLFPRFTLWPYCFHDSSSQLIVRRAAKNWSTFCSDDAHPAASGCG